MKLKGTAWILFLSLFLSGCGEALFGSSPKITGEELWNPPPHVSDLGDDSKSFGETLESLGAYDGFFESDSKDVKVEWVSGTKQAYKLEGNTLTFTAISEKTVYSLSGTFRGNILIDVGDGFSFDLELCGFSLVCGETCPIFIRSGDEVAIQAKKDTKNYLYDQRETVDSSDEAVVAGAIHSETDLEIGGKGELTVVSEHNNGIHSKDDLQVKNLTLLVACTDNALKGNDSVTIESGNTTLIASEGDCIKTSNSDVSAKGNQRGSVTVSGGTHTLYAARDAIDAAYNVTVEGANTLLNLYTDKYSNYSKEVTATSSDLNYIRFSSDRYHYSVKYYNSDTDFLWVNAEYHSKVGGGRTVYYYYSYPKKTEYAKQQFFLYESASQLGQEQEYLVKSELLTSNSAYDTFALTARGNQLSYAWTNYTTKIQGGGFGGPGGGPGGMQDGNSDKSDYSAKGIKAANEIVICGGTVNVKAYDDAIHANSDTALENGASPLGNVTVSGGVLNLYSNDDGIHADGTLFLSAGKVSIANSYEGLEGTNVLLAGGTVSVYAKDDGINATAFSGTGVTVSGGSHFICCTGDGIDSNSRSAYSGIVFSGGKTVVISNSGGNSAIDTENGYTHTGGAVIALMPRGGMSNEATHCKDFSKSGTTAQLTLTEGGYLTVKIGESEAALKMSVGMNALVIVLGDSSARVDFQASFDETTDQNGVWWKENGAIS